jgi:capping protein beta
MSGRAKLSPEAAARELLRHVDPDEVEDRLFDCIKLNHAVTDELLSTVDIPLKTGTDSAGNKFILCDYNRDSDSYRSPFTNTYTPSVSKGYLPPEHLRQMESMANKGFQSYLRQYFDYGVCSVYCWEVDDTSFGFGVFIKKDLELSAQGAHVLEGSISCADVCQVSSIPKRVKEFQYSLVSSALVSIRIGAKVGQKITLNGTVNDEKVATAGATSAIQHIITIGTMIEENADRFVEKIRGIYVGKMKEILSYLKIDQEYTVSQTAQDLLAGGLKST